MAYHHTDKDIRSKLYVPVTVTFTAVAYPDPRFTWEKLENSSWHNITNDIMFTISSLKLQSNLTVNNFTATAANAYRLIVENEIGSLIQNYTISPLSKKIKDIMLAVMPNSNNYLTPLSIYRLQTS